jgi:hypothetical protein
MIVKLCKHNKSPKIKNACTKQFLTTEKKHQYIIERVDGLDVNTDERWRIFPKGTQTTVFLLEIPSDNPSKSVMETRTLNEVVKEQAILSPVEMRTTRRPPSVTTWDDVSLWGM